MSTFSIGQYARHISTGSIIQIHTLTSETINGYPLTAYTPWKPAANEPCWFFLDHQSFCYVQNVPYFGIYNRHIVGQKDVLMKGSTQTFSYCIPFIGELPY